MTLRRFYFVLFLLTFNASLQAEAKLIDKTVALVNSDVVLHSDIAKFNKNLSLRRELDPYIALTKFNSQKTEDIVNYLVQENLVLQQFTPTKDEVEEEINAVQRNNKIDRDNLKQVLKGQGVQYEDYVALMRVSVAKRKLVERELRPLSVITDDEVKNHYYTDSNFLARKKDGKLVLSYNLLQLLLPNRPVADEASKRLHAGGDFDAVAADLSAQGAEKGSLGTLSEDRLSETIVQAIAGLKVGESTAPIATGGGYMILKIVEIGAPKDPVYEHEKEGIRNQLFQKALLSQLALWTEKERARSYVYIP